MEIERRRTVFIFIKQDQTELSSCFYYKDIRPEEGENSYFIITRNDTHLSFQRDFIYMPYPLSENNYNQGPINPDFSILEHGLCAKRFKIRALEQVLKN